MSAVQILMDMGFTQERVEYALEVTNNKGVEPAMEWLLAHIDEDIPRQTAGKTTTSATNDATAAASPAAAAATTAAAADAATTADATASSSSTAPGELVAKSLKCDNCGKILKDTTEVEYHAAKTGHSNFSESTEEKKPLTEEEKKAQLIMIEEKLKQKRLEREEREKADSLEREKNRIKSGKDMTEARRRMEDIEMQKIVEQRKREKAEEKAARDRVRAQIEADKAARRAREQPKAEQNAATVSSTTPTLPTTTIASTSSAVKPAPKEYTETRIQIRLQDGATLTETFNVKEQLSAVRVYIQMKTNIETPFALMTTFPRKIFIDDDYEKPLEILGLVPSAVLIMTKSNAS